MVWAEEPGRVLVHLVADAIPYAAKNAPASRSLNP
jgi:hypothetical protein